MKRIVFLSAVIFLVVCISSCSKEERMKKIVKELLYEQLDDPKSYEAGSFTFKDERTYNISDTLLTEDLRKDIEIAEQNIEYFKENKIYSKESTERYIALQKKYIEIMNTLIDIHDLRANKIKNIENASTVIDCIHEFRAKNKMGAVVKTEIKVGFDENLNILYYTIGDGEDS